MVQVLAPVSGIRLEVADLPDPVFSAGIVGPGAAIRPRPGQQSALAPIDGILTKIHPHAYVILSDRGPGVLVHLGIDTVQMNGAGFTTLAEEQVWVHAGQEIVRWDPARVERSGRSALCAVFVLDCACPALAASSPGSAVAAADPLFSIDC